MVEKKETDAERRRKFPKAFKVGFMDRRDAVLAGDSSKDRRHGPDMQAMKDFTSAHAGTMTLGEHCALANLHDRFRRFKTHIALAEILDRRK